jgi:F0F1-type ATP synthase assembly protein I
MYSNYTDSETIRKGQKKVFASKQKLELILPNGKKDGELEVGDLVYVIQKIKKGRKVTIRFRVMKYGDSSKERMIYASDLKYFAPYFEQHSGVDAESAKEPKEASEAGTKRSYRVPMITSLAGGVLGYLMAQKFNKSKWLFSVVGIAAGLSAGIFLIRNKKKDGQD